VLRAVAVMHVDIDNRDPIDAGGAQCRRGHRMLLNRQNPIARSRSA
jgi:hypothetical protein